MGVAVTTLMHLSSVVPENGRRWSGGYAGCALFRLYPDRTDVDCRRWKASGGGGFQYGGYPCGSGRICSLVWQRRPAVHGDGTDEILFDQFQRNPTRARSASARCERARERVLRMDRSTQVEQLAQPGRRCLASWQAKKTVRWIRRGSEIDLYYSKTAYWWKNWSTWTRLWLAITSRSLSRRCGRVPESRIPQCPHSGHRPWDKMTEVEILDGKVVHELLFDGAGNWLFTKTEMSHAALPSVVSRALDASGICRLPGGR